MSKISKLAAGSAIAATAVLGGASVALADGYAAPRVAYERPSNWSGVYFGVDSGYAVSLRWTPPCGVARPGSKWAAELPCGFRAGPKILIAAEAAGTAGQRFGGCYG